MRFALNMIWMGTPRRQMPGQRISVSLATGLGSFCAFAAAPAAAQEYCVACTDPPAVYRCVVDGAQPRGGQSLQMLCVTAMAREGGHGTCSVKRGTVFECDATVKHVPWTMVEPAPAAPQETPQPAAAMPPLSPASPAQPAAPPPAAAPATPPQTVLDLAKQANEKTTEQMKKAGDTVKDATKKTWDCVFSLFTRC